MTKPYMQRNVKKVYCRKCKKRHYSGSKIMIKHLRGK